MARSPASCVCCISRREHSPPAQPPLSQAGGRVGKSSSHPPPHPPGEKANELPNFYDHFSPHWSPTCKAQPPWYPSPSKVAPSALPPPACTCGGPSCSPLLSYLSYWLEQTPSPPSFQCERHLRPPPPPDPAPPRTCQVRGAVAVTLPVGVALLDGGGAVAERGGEDGRAVLHQRRADGRVVARGRAVQRRPRRGGGRERRERPPAGGPVRRRRPVPSPAPRPPRGPGLTSRGCRGS